MRVLLLLSQRIVTSELELGSNKIDHCGETLVSMIPSGIPFGSLNHAVNTLAYRVDQAHGEMFSIDSADIVNEFGLLLLLKLT